MIDGTVRSVAHALLHLQARVHNRIGAECEVHRHPEKYPPDTAVVLRGMRQDHADDAAVLAAMLTTFDAANDSGVHAGPEVA